MPVVMTSTNPFDAQAWVRHDVDHAGLFLVKHFKGHWPETARIYAGSVALTNDVTPRSDDPESIERLETAESPLWVVVSPGLAISAATTFQIVALLASVAAVILIPDPKVKTPRERDTADGSPNNALGARGNKARVMGRIPDIYGVVRSVPDSLMVPYTVYENHRETQIGYYCIGRHDFEVGQERVRDGDTRIDQIDNAAAHFYSPGQAPTGLGLGPYSGDILAIGDAIEDPVLNVYQIRAVNGQVMDPPNNNVLYGAVNETNENGTATSDFDFLHIQYLTASTGVLWIPHIKSFDHVRDRLAIGDRLILQIAQGRLLASTSTTPNLNTTLPDTPEEPEIDFPWDDAMIVTGMTDSLSWVAVEVDIPAALQAQWALVDDYVSGLTDVSNVQIADTFPAFSSVVNPVGMGIIGPFFVDFEHPLGSQNQHVICNFVAPNGLYMDDGANIDKLSVDMMVRLTPCDSSGNPTDDSEFQEVTLEGADTAAGNQRAVTLRFTPTFEGRFLITAWRVTDRMRRERLTTAMEVDFFPSYDPDFAYTGLIVDQIKWTHAYTVSTPPNISFGNVTTVHTKTVAQEGVAQTSQREFNCIVRRKIDTWKGTGGGGFSGPEVANGAVENVLFSIMKDQYLGNRSDDQIDFEQIADAYQEVRDYFSVSAATDVSITFDDSNTSFEEMIQAISAIAFGFMYRQGSVIRTKTDLEAGIAARLLNHRNILPASQKVTHRFGLPNDFDSVQVDYTDPFDDAIVPVTAPTGATTFRPKNVKVPGLRTEIQAYLHAFRAYQRMIHQRQSLEMQTTQEAAELVITDRMLVADITRLNQQVGEIRSTAGLSVQLSQQPTFEIDREYTMFLQHSDGTVEGIGVSQGSAGPYSATLASAPSVPLVTDPEDGVRTMYTIVAADESMPKAYMLSELSPESNMVMTVAAVNYSHLYYFADSLQTWFQSGIADRSPFGYQMEPSGTGTSSTSDPVHGSMVAMDGGGSFESEVLPGNSDFTNIGSWTAAAWVVRNDNDALGVLLDTTDGSRHCFFGFESGDLVAGIDNVISVRAAIPFSELHHVAVTYQEDLQRIALFIDGLIVDVATSIGVPSLNGRARYGNAYDGAFEGLVRYHRALSDDAIAELHAKTKRFA